MSQQTPSLRVFPKTRILLLKRTWSAPKIPVFASTLRHRRLRLVDA
jgi:hypothetical protein